MFATLSQLGIDHAAYRLVPAAVWLAILWMAETYFSKPQDGKLQHGAINLGLAALNGGLLFFSVGLLSVYVCSLASVELFSPLRFAYSFLALDLFSYLWHRANHRFALLWQFHAVHHSDSAMDVTTSGRFHVVELGIAGMVRLPLLFMFGVSTAELLIYETALVMVSMLHHSTISLGRFDFFARTVIVTPSVHSVHHSRDPDLYGYNYASVLSIWDRLFRTFRMSSKPIQHGLDSWNDNQTVQKLLAAPFRDAHNCDEQSVSPEPGKMSEIR